MKAIILAAGRGSRMGQHTDSQPKCRTELHGKSLINWQLDSLKAGGVNDIAIVRGYLANTFDFDVTYFENKNWANSNMVTSLLQADEWLRQNDCIISYADIIYSPQIIKDLFKDDSEKLAVAYDINWLTLWSKRFKCIEDDAESFMVTNGSIEEIGNPITDIAKVNGQYMGLMKMTPSVWTDIRHLLLKLTQLEIAQLDMTGLLKRLLESNLEIKGVVNDLPWYEVDSPSDLEVYRDLPQISFNS